MTVEKIDVAECNKQ